MLDYQSRDRKIDHPPPPSLVFRTRLQTEVPSPYDLVVGGTLHSTSLTNYKYCSLISMESSDHLSPKQPEEVNSLLIKLTNLDIVWTVVTMNCRRCLKWNSSENKTQFDNHSPVVKALIKHNCNKTYNSPKIKGKPKYINSRSGITFG